MTDASHALTDTALMDPTYVKGPLSRLGALIAAYFKAPEVQPAVPPRTVDHCTSLQLAPAPGSEIRIEHDGDTLIIHGAVLARHGGDRSPFGEPQKFYY